MTGATAERGTTRVLTKVERKLIKELRWLVDYSGTDDGWNGAGGLPPEGQRGRRATVAERAVVERVATQTRQPAAAVQRALTPLFERLVQEGVLLPFAPGKPRHYIDHDTLNTLYPPLGRA